MFTSMPDATAVADAHRRELMADAANYRLARLAKAALHRDAALTPRRFRRALRARPVGC